MAKHSLNEEILVKHNITLNDNVMHIDTFKTKAYVSIDKISAVELDLKWMIVGFTWAFVLFIIGLYLKGSYSTISFVLGFILAISSYFSVMVKVYPIGYKAVVIAGAYHSMKELFYELRKLV
jgi:hypothetical protein